MSRWNLSWLLGITAAALIGVSITYSMPKAHNKKHQNLKLVAEVLEEVESRYVKKLSEKQMRELVENMINGGLEKLDPHSAFSNADEYKSFNQQNQGKFSGVGMRITVDGKTGAFIVESPIPGTPAYEAGILANDIILKVDGKAVDNWSLRQLVEAIQGEAGTDVTLTVRHEGAKSNADIKMTRAEIKIESVMGDKRDKIDLKKWDFWLDEDARIAYVRVTAFTKTATDELTLVVDALQKLGLKGLIIDLRGNPGGLLNSAVDVASMFVPEGKEIVSIKGREDKVEKVHLAKMSGNMKPATYYPIAILIDRRSASASEIVAAALQDHARAIIIGERSYGKGSVQNLIEMEHGQTALKLTTASYWRPSGRNIHRFPDSQEEDDWGVKPDMGYEVKLTLQELIDYYNWRRERDIISRPGDAKPPENGAKKAEFRDKVLDKAVEYIRAEIPKWEKKAPEKQ